MSFSSKNIVFLDSVDSTNNYAMGLIRKGDFNAGNAVFAMEQTQGKGRPGKEWKSNKGDNILLSIPLQMQWLPLSSQFSLSVAIALGCLNLISQNIFSNYFIKWPNDLFINDRKAGGILIENVIKGKEWKWAVVGIGLNINQQRFNKVNSSATSFFNETGFHFDVSKLTVRLYECVLERIEDLKAGLFEKMLEEYNFHLYARGKKVKLKKENILFETEIIGVSFSGKLITKDSLERRFGLDEVQFKGLVE